MTWTGLQDERRTRLAFAMLLVQIAIVEWLINNAFWPLGEWFYTNFQFDPFQFHIDDVLYFTSLGRIVLLFIATWIITRGLRGLLPIAGGWMIFMFLLIAVLRRLIPPVFGLVNLLYADGVGGDLLVTNPLTPLLEAIGGWMWFAMWLLMIIGGAAIVHEINRSYERRIVKTGRIRTLVVVALIGWGTKCLHEFYGIDIVSALLTSTVGDMENVQGIVTLTSAYGFVVHFIPGAVLCALLFFTTKHARRALRSPYPPPCPDCGQALVASTANHCTECDWRSVVSADGR